MLRAFLDRRRIQKTLAKYVSPDVVREITSGSFTAPPLKQRVIEFAFVAISAPDAARYSQRAGAVAELAFGHGAAVHSLMPVVTIGFGVFDAGSRGDRGGFVADLQSQFADAAVVHGRVAADLGNFGTSSRLDVGFWWPGMVAALRQLSSLAPGEAHELR